MINLDIIGHTFQSSPFQYDQDNVILYALGIGADIDNLDFVYERNLKIYPTFAVVPLVPTLMELIKVARLNMRSLLHGEQKIELFQPIPVKGELIIKATCQEIFDKGDKGAVLNIISEGCDKEGESLFRHSTVLIDTKAGHFGGARGPKSVGLKLPLTNPDFSHLYKTSYNQAAIYRLSGDKNPLHIDPSFAHQAGYDTPILHGLCTMGIAARAIVHAVCGGEPNAVRSITARFNNVVFPGDTLITEGWFREEKHILFRTIHENEKEVLMGEVSLV